MSKIILFTGYAGVGKDTSADIIYNITRGVKRGLADAIREDISKKFNIPIEIMESQNTKNKPFCELILQEELGLTNIRTFLLNESPRTLMQKWGAMFRNNFSNEYWCEQWDMYFRDYEDNMMTIFPLKMIPDIRYNNEVNYFKSKVDEVCTVYVAREGHSKINNHESEEGVTSKHIDVYVENNGTFDDLRMQLITKLGSFIE